jgi:hypothetical protein
VNSKPEIEPQVEYQSSSGREQTGNNFLEEVTEVPNYNLRMWEIIQKNTRISTKKSELSSNFLKIESSLQKQADSHNFLLEIKKNYEEKWGNPFKNKYDFAKMKKYIKEDISIRYLDKQGGFF